jgi:hypothetical protein
MVRLDPADASAQGATVKHRQALLVAVSLALVLGLLFVGRARAAGLAWVPSPGDTWQYQLSGAIDTTVDADVFDLDASTRRSVIDEIHAAGGRAVCYFDAVSW